MTSERQALIERARLESSQGEPRTSFRRPNLGMSSVGVHRRHTCGATGVVVDAAQRGLRAHGANSDVKFVDAAHDVRRQVAHVAVRLG